MTENHDFAVEYSYTHRAVWHDVSKAESAPDQPSFCTEEVEPHIVFTPYIRELVRTLTEGVTDPLEKARRFYDFITCNMHYSYMPEYFTLESIAENCARNGIGDCGVFALLFITLCRCAGIPAEWQSGMCAEPEGVGSHDWARFYVAPYGWLYADPSFGVSANRNGKEERRQFYFTSLDPYRLVANSAFQAPFTIEKQQWRGDPYDNQTGEMETADRGLRYSEYESQRDTLLCEEID
jgi:transglutaminase-like putative cysteine protease